jgi:hypothetical protein
MWTSPDFGASPVCDVSSVIIKVAQPRPDRPQRSKISPDGVDGLRLISSNVGTASPIDAFKALTLKASESDSDQGVHGELSLHDPTEQLRMLVLALTDKDASRDFVGQQSTSGSGSDENLPSIKEWLR